MSSESAYELAEKLHVASMESIEGKSFHEQRVLGVQEATFKKNRTKKLHADGVIEGRKAYQTFSRAKNNDIYLCTVFVQNDGKDTKTMHRFTPDGGGSVEAIVALGNSFFAQRVGV